MTKKELQLENLVLKNVLDCLIEEIELLNCSDIEGKYPVFAGCVESIVSSRERSLKNALKDGYTLDFRHSVCTSDRIIRLYPDGIREEILRKQLPFADGGDES